MFFYAFFYAGTLIIEKMSRTSGAATGGEEVYIFTNKIKGFKKGTYGIALPIWPLSLSCVS